MLKKENRQMQAGALKKKAFRAYNVYSTEPTNNLTYKDITNDLDRKAFYLTWYSINKSVTLGLLIGQSFENDNIPLIYKTVINKIVELVSND